MFVIILSDPIFAPSFLFNQKISNMKKIILGALLIAGIGFSAKAQDGEFKFNAGLELGLPMGTFGDAFSFGFGASVQANYGLGESLWGTGSVGFMNFAGKTVNGFTFGSSGLIPIKVGVRYMLSEQFFVHPELGVSLSTASGGGSSFTYAGGLGYMASENLSVAARFESLSQTGGSSSFIGFRVGYTF
jgi:hypothetical protein